MPAGSPSRPSIPVAAALAFLVAGAGIGVLLPIDLEPTEPVLHPQAQLNADAAARFAVEATVPVVAPPFMTTLGYSTVEETGREVRFQLQNRNAVICDVRPDTASTACETDGFEVLRTERHGDRSVTVGLLAPDPQADANVENLTAAELDFVRAYWRSVPLQTGDLPRWVVDLAEHARRSV